MPYVGLVNPNVTCFINAIIQMLYRIPEFKNIAIDPVKGYFTKMDAAEAKSRAEPVDLELGEKSTEFECPLDYEKEQKGKKRKQKDAAEFLLNSIFNRIGNENLGLLKFTVNTTSYCKDIAGTKSNANPVGEIQTILTLPISTCNTVEKCITEYGKEENLGVESQLDSCKKVAGLTSHKKMDIVASESQKYLIVQLSRFQVDPNTYESTKIVKDIDITPVITLSGVRWALEGAVLHTGTLSSGHYRYMWKEATGNWILFNDSAVTTLTKEERIADIRTNGYILVYKKINGTPKKTRKAVRFNNGAKKHNGNRATQKEVQTKKTLVKTQKVQIKKAPVNTQKIQTKKPLVKTQKHSKSFINRLLTPKDKAEYTKSIYTNDPLLKELVDKYVKQ
jgi:uncharacterized UBP type Zn finger protein